MRTKFLRLLLVVFSLCKCSLAFAQEASFGSSELSQVLFDPTSAAGDEAGSLSFIYRRAKHQAVDFKSQFFGVNLPNPRKLLTKKSKLFASLSLFRKEVIAADFFRSQSLGLSLGYNLRIGRDDFIAFGLQPNYHSLKTSLDHFTTGNQWIADELRFDPAWPTGEPLVQHYINNFGINSGLRWYKTDGDTQRTIRFLSICGFNLNRPRQSFFNDDFRIRPGFVIHGGARLVQRNNYNLKVNGIFTSSYTQSLNVVATNEFTFRNNNPYDLIGSGSIELILNATKSITNVAIAVNQPGLTFIVCYGFSSRHAANANINPFELGLRFKIEKQTASSEENAPKPKGKPTRKFSFTNNDTVKTSPVDTVHTKIQTYSKVRSVKYELEKHFQFESGKTVLNAEAKSFLDAILKLMNEDDQFHLDVIGHTDNVGSKFVNFKLSEARANSVADYLIENGIASNRVHAKGVGDTQPLFSNDSEENKARNRRVQFIIYVNK
jgi:outer membrane protein OmpA-like peptidoglycan-associated protein